MTTNKTKVGDKVVYKSRAELREEGIYEPHFESFLPRRLGKVWKVIVIDRWNSYSLRHGDEIARVGGHLLKKLRG